MPTTQQDQSAKNFKTPVVVPKPVDLSSITYENASIYDKALDYRVTIIEKATGNHIDFTTEVEKLRADTLSYQQRVQDLESKVQALNGALTKILSDLSVIKTPVSIPFDNNGTVTP